MRKEPRPTNRCPSCGADDLMTVSFEVDGEEILFRVCPPCEARWWERDGAKIDLAVALPLVTG